MTTNTLLNKQLKAERKNERIRIARRMRAARAALAAYNKCFDMTGFERAYEFTSTAAIADILAYGAKCGFDPTEKSRRALHDALTLDKAESE